MRNTFSVLTAIALAGCVTAYTEPPASSSSASLTFTRHSSVPRWGNTQILQIVSDERCTSRNRVKDFIPLGSQDPHTFRVEAGARRYFHFESIHTEGGALGFQDTSCANIVSYVPEAGHSYTMAHVRQPRACSVEIVDTATGARPPTLVVHPYDRNCVQVW